MRFPGSTTVRVLLLAASLAALPASAADRAYSAEAPFAPKAVAQSLRLAPGGKAALRIALGEADAGEIASVKKANTESFNKRLQIGVGRMLPESAPTRGGALQWQPVDGGYAAHWEITSAGARALRVEFDGGALPAGAELRFAGSGDPGTVYGPYDAAGLEAAGRWSPVLEGERATVEVFVPAGSTGDVGLGLARVSHLFVSPADPNADVLAKDSQFCEVDLICRSASDAALASVGRAVARMTFSDGLGGGTALCTGTLLNTTAGPVAPYFYSAAHCISTQASASTLTTHWFYDRTGCGTGGVSGSYVQVGGGSTMLYFNTTTDVLFVRLNQNPPSGAVYAGWDAATLGTGTAMTAVHHPAGDVKKVSLATSGGFSAYGGGTGDSHLIALWNSTATGVTEGGSSGSGIFTFGNSQYLLRGGLHGGPSSCSATGADLRDYYSRFDRAYQFVSQYLNPGTTTCTFSLSPASATVGPGTSSGSFSVNTQSGCQWTANSSQLWLQINGSGSGTGSGTVSYTATANSAASARSATITVGGQVFTVTQQAGTGGTTTELVTNGGFESGSSGWTQQASGGAAIITSDATRARTGSGVAWLGGYDNGTDSLSQTITIPAGATTATLRFWYRISTAETVAGMWDTLKVQVLNPGGTVLETLVTYSNQNASTAWNQSSGFSLLGYAGQTIRLRFLAETDSSLSTSFYIDDITIPVQVTAGTSANYTALWWNPNESGWGVNLNHQGDIVFGTLFTYDASGVPLWLVLPAGNLQSGTTYSGELYRTTGPAFNANPFTPIGPGNLTVVGSMTVTFSGSNSATLTYTYNGTQVTKSIQRQVFGSRAANCTPTTGNRASLTNYQDLWWNANESGWGVNVTHQDNILFATLFTYDATGRDLWLVLPAGTLQSDGSYLGDLYRTTGPPFNANPFTPINAGNLTIVGTMRFRFTNGENGTLTYSYNGTTVTKAITRQVFSTTTPACG
ncbi:MAG: choice-of-anchor J domain-containing protein [Burkholderiales bacterium]|nr:choice-of-anchor J domain-containing protein [Burkholderiales bacterium]